LYYIIVVYLYQQKQIKNLKPKTMKTLTNTSGTKAVKITKDATGAYRAAYIQIYKGEEQVLEFRSYNTLTAATKYANKILN